MRTAERAQRKPYLLAQARFGVFAVLNAVLDQHRMEERRAAAASLTIGGSCLGSLTAEAAGVRMKSVTNAAAPNPTIRTPASTIAGLFWNRLRSYAM
jgi:hypothetical protein